MWPEVQRYLYRTSDIGIPLCPAMFRILLAWLFQTITRLAFHPRLLQQWLNWVLHCEILLARYALTGLGCLAQNCLETRTQWYQPNVKVG
jgi:hypothetical protein